jgi:hypothetical protein
MNMNECTEMLTRWELGHLKAQLLAHMAEQTPEWGKIPNTNNPFLELIDFTFYVLEAAQRRDIELLRKSVQEFFEGEK